MIHDVFDGLFDRDGALPVQADGGLKCFGHPIGASGLRIVYEIYLQTQGRAGERQLPVSGATCIKTYAQYQSSGLK